MMFHHLSLNCTDLLAIERFYSKHFGFQRARVIDLPDGRQIVFLRGGGVYLELFPAQGGRPASPVQVNTASKISRWMKSWYRWND